MFDFSAQTFFLLAIAILAVGGIGAFVLRRSDRLANWWGNGAAFLASVFGIVVGWQVLVNNAAFILNIPSVLPELAFTLRVDKLSAFFIVVVSLIASATSLYGIGYVRHFYGRYDIGALGFFYNAFLGGVLLVVSAGNALFFLLAWEMMALASYFLVVFENREKESVSAGSLYFIMTHAGAGLIAIAFLLLYRASGSLDFTVFAAGNYEISPLVAHAVFVLTLIGFGIKAGIIPLHIWLPRAHAAAPSHVSALMSGVMIKTGIYMLIRFYLEFLPQPIPLSWGIGVLVLGAISSLFGVLYALTEHDLKRLLAYHSIENIGIILLGLGSALIFASAGMNGLAALSLVAALFHTLNHAIFKALLFMGAGAVISGTHTRNMEEMGGLIKRLPQTAIFFLVGSLAISALPPFNGFFSEWLTFQALFSGLQSFGGLPRWFFIFVGGALAFTGGLAAACFVKVFGIVFLARPRSHEAEMAHEAPLASRIAMGILALLTLVIGLGSGKVVGLLVGVAAELLPVSFGAISVQDVSLSVAGGFAFVSAPVIFIVLLGGLLFAWFFMRMIYPASRTRIGRTWDCGANLSPRTEITATGFSRSIIMIFRGLLLPTKQTDVEYRDAAMRYFPKLSTVHLGMRDIYGSYLYEPLREIAFMMSGYAKRIQIGNVNIYVLYIFLTLIALLILLN